MKKAFFALLLAAAMLLVSSCSFITFPSKEKTDAVVTEEKKDGGVEIPEGMKRFESRTEEKKAKAQSFLDALDPAPLGKDTFTLAVYDGFSFAPNTASNYYEEALIERNGMVKEKYGIELKELSTPTELMLEDSYGAFIYNSRYADAMVIPASEVGEFAEKGHLLNIYSIPDFTFDAEYFDSENMEQMTAGTRAYAITGSFTRDIGSYYCVYVNTALLAKTGLADPTALVKNGTWTWDRFSEYLLAFLYADSENYAVACDSVREAVDVVYKSAGLDYLQTRFDRTPTVAFDDERTDRVSTYLRTVFWSRPYYKQEGQPTAAEVFASGKTLFAFCTVGDMSTCANLGTDWTILPVPKLDQAQEDYISYLSPEAPVLVIPASSPDPEATARIITALFAASYEFPDDGYYSYLTATAANSSTTLDMLDCICGIRSGKCRAELVDLYSKTHPELKENTTDAVRALAEDESKSRSSVAGTSASRLAWRLSKMFPTG